MRYEWFIAKRYLRPQGGATFIFHLTLISMAGVALGVTSLITVLSVMNGFGNDLRAKILQGRSHIVLKYTNGLQNYEQILPAFAAIENVEAYSPVILNWGMLIPTELPGGGHYPVSLIGIDPKREIAVTQIDKKLIAGTLVPLSDDGSESSDNQKVKITEVQPKRIHGILIGKELANSLFGIPDSEEKKEKVYEAVLGQHVTLITVPDDRESLSMDWKENLDFQVVGVFDSGHYEFDSTWVYISIPDAQSLFHLAGAVTDIQFRLKDHSQEATLETRKEIYTVNRERVGTGYPETWMEMNRTFFNALTIEKRTMNYILKIIILVATFNIIATLFMVVTEKTRDIGLLRAVGAGRWNILKLFLLLGILVGTIGAVLGVAGGFSLCKIIQWFPPELPGEGQIYYLKYLPCEMEWTDFIGVALYTLLVSFLASLYPAIRASRLIPIEALRFS